MKSPLAFRNFGIWIAFFCLAGVAGVAGAASIAGSKHDLSDMGTGSGASKEICVFCHTPHNASSQIDAPLWNRKITNMSIYTSPYKSDTMNTTPSARPNAVSLACLSCHDAIYSQGEPSAVHGGDQHTVLNTWNSPRCTACHPGGAYPGTWWRIGPNLSNDHPISMSYPTPAQDSNFNLPPDPNTGWNDVKLFGGKVECPTCHNAHDPGLPKFLRKSNGSSSLCFTCHKL